MLFRGVGMLLSCVWRVVVCGVVALLWCWVGLGCDSLIVCLLDCSIVCWFV